jgi:hypothetical protein
MAAGMLGALLLAPTAAGAHPRIAVGGVVGVPAWPAPGYPYGLAGPAPLPWAGDDATLPPGWVAGRWEWRRDRDGDRYPVWTPPHLR